MKQDNNTSTVEETGFLPNFCHIRMVFAVVILAELMAFAIVLTSPSLTWGRLGTLSLFMQWIALGSAGLLCILRQWMRRFSDIQAGFISYLLVLLVTLVVSELAYWLMLELGVPQQRVQHVDFLLRTLAVSAILSGISLRVIYLQHQQKVQLQVNAEARVQALQARIRPHFLFNSMNTIASLIRTEPDVAEAAIEDLSDLFRASLGQKAQLIMLADEVQIAKRYLHIEQLRLGQRLQVTWQMDSLPDDALLPVLSLQPLLENAIFHGVEMLAEGGEIFIKGTLERNWMHIEITNPCVPPQQSQRSGGNQMAMENINERLQIAFGKQAGLDIDRQPQQCKLHMHFPYRRAP